MAGASSTTTIELRGGPVHRLDGTTKPPAEGQQGHDASATTGRVLGRGSSHEREGISALPAPASVSHPAERWNQSRANVLRVLAAFWSLLVMGMNDAAYGAIIPYLGAYYRLDYTAVSLIFLSPFAGYTLSALLNAHLHERVGQRGIAALTSGCHLAAYAAAAARPPYPALVVAYALAGLGNGLGDAAWNAWVGNMASANEVLGVLHACYGAGGVLAPLVATAMVARAGLQWYHFYYVMIGAAAVEAAALVSAFWAATGEVFREAHPRATTEAGGGGGSSLREALLALPAARVTWLCAAFLLVYVGVEVALGGWIVKFMMEVRDGGAFASGMTATGFWLGITVGRVVLGFVTPLLGERLAVMIYIPAAMGLELLFWLVPRFLVSAVAVSLQGFFLGPLFPAVVVAATRSLPRRLHVSAVGFAAAFGAGGAAVLPFAVGAIAQSRGVGVLQPVVLALLGVLLLLWAALPGFGRKKD